MLPNIIKNEKNCTINLTEWESNTFKYIYALQQSNARYGLNYTIEASISDEPNEEIELWHFWFNSYLDSQINLEKYNKIEIKNVSAYGFISGYPNMTLTRKYNFTSKSNLLCLFLQTYGVN